MPRIDPERLLRTLAPLLEPSTGAIKSDKEVDKIYGLMSKFSRKLVSKCTYINILKASDPDVLDLFLQRGGWDMVHDWTVDAQSKRNYDLLKEIGGLLLCAPASIQRLKENELPKVVKSLSKDCENEEIREIAKQVVAKWIAIAKHPASPSAVNKPIHVDDTAPTNVLKIDNLMGSETVPADFDISAFDISHADLNGIMDFNPEDFSKAVDQHLNEVSTESTTAGLPVVPVNETNNKVKSEHVVGIPKMEPPPGDTMQKAPKILIKTIAGQKAVVQGVGGVTEPNKQGDAPFCIIMRDGKPFLVRLKLASPNTVNQIPVPLQVVDEKNAKPIEVSIPPADKQRRPRKDPSIVNARKPAEEKHVPNILKTYSKTKPLEQVPSVSEDSVAKVKTSEKPAKSADKVKRPRSGSSKSGSAAAAAAAKKQAEEDKLKEKIKQGKITLKKRAKDAAKQKQQEKDQETLKKLNLTIEPSKTSPSSTPSTSMKIPKIPKKQSSFADAIGVPGSVEPLIAVSDKSNKNKSPSKSNSHDAASETADGDKSKFYGKSEEAAKSEHSQERRHRVKVFSSKKSRSDDLLKDMTETVKNNKANNNKSDSTGKESNSQSTMMGDKSAAVHSIIAGAKPEKRPSTEGIEKPGDTKKQKLSDEKAERDKKKEKENKAAKEKAKIAAANVIKESSLFMDALTASSDNSQKSMKRKRRLSSSNEKEALPVGKPGRTLSISGDKSHSPRVETPTESIKPAFNFYRDTMADNDGRSPSPTKPDSTVDDSNIMDMDTSNNRDADDKSSEEDPFAPTPTVYEGPLKSALVILRSKDKPKKFVRWREEDEIKEVFWFELDQEERVNVTKQKDFMSMKEQEKAEEKEFLATNLKRRILGADEVEEKMPWRKPVHIVLPSSIEIFPCTSEEKAIQEEREKTNLGLFLPPGSILPDNPAEPDPMSPDINEKEKIEPRVIPMEDVVNVTKVYDKRNDLWPKPDGVPMGPRAPKGYLSISSGSGREQPYGIPNFNINEMPPIVPGPGFSHPQPIPQVDYSNPWTNNFSAPPPSMLPNVADMSGFQQAPTVMNIPPPNMGFGNPFGFPLPNSVPNFPIGVGFPPNPAQMLANNLNNNISNPNHASPHHSSRGRGGTGRDYGDRDLRTSFRDRREPYESRSRDSYDSRTRSRDHHRSRDHDRDRRSPSPTRRRRDERDRHGRDDKDYRDHDYRSRGRSGKKDVLCRYFKKGHCHSGNRCEFSHSDPSTDSQTHDKPRDVPRARHSSPSLLSGEEESSGSGSANNILESIESQFERRPSREDGSTTNFTDAPSSPTDEIQEDPSLLLTSVAEPAKIIPVE